MSTQSLHLGSGARILQGWLNLDLKPRDGVIQADLTKRLKYKDNSVDMIYTEHFLEHISEVEGFRLLGECYRVLKKGGVLRIVTPDIVQYVDVYRNWDKAGKDGFDTKEQWLNYAMIGETLYSGKKLLCKQGKYGAHGHQFIYSTEDLRRKSETLGFSDFRTCKYHESSSRALRGLEIHGKDNLQLIVELVK